MNVPEVQLITVPRSPATTVYAAVLLEMVRVALPPAGVAQVASPRQNVDADADVPELRLVTGRLPVTPVVSGKPVALVNTPAEGVPIFGVTKTGEFDNTTLVVPVLVVTPVPPFKIGNAVPDKVIASVPEVVIGEPATDKNVGTVAATLVTVPVPVGAAHDPSPRQNVEADADVPELRLVTGKLPVTPVVNGSPVRLVAVPDEGVPRAPPLTKFPLAVPVNAAVIVPASKLPLASRATIALAVFADAAVVAELLTFKAVEIVASLVSTMAADAFISALTIAPAVIDVAFPTDVIGPVRFALIVAVPVAFPVPPLATGNAVPEYVIASVPEVVIGEPEMLKILGTVAATLVTVPEPPPVDEFATFNIIFFSS